MRLFLLFSHITWSVTIRTEQTKDLFETLTVDQLDKKFPEFYEARHYSD